ncbi:hypothetical protein FRC07_010712 [Ceratobasidium sp. 392]|nr:hypothetical protein FRC07_010712 [Ceratobasidium sp. 392]
MQQPYAKHILSTNPPTGQPANDLATAVTSSKDHSYNDKIGDDLYAPHQLRNVALKAFKRGCLDWDIDRVRIASAIFHRQSSDTYTIRLNLRGKLGNFSDVLMLYSPSHHEVLGARKLAKNKDTRNLPELIANEFRRKGALDTNSCVGRSALDSEQAEVNAQSNYLPPQRHTSSATDPPETVSSVGQPNTTGPYAMRSAEVAPPPTEPIPAAKSNSVGESASPSKSPSPACSLSSSYSPNSVSVAQSTKLLTESSASGHAENNTLREYYAHTDDPNDDQTSHLYSGGRTTWNAISTLPVYSSDDATLQTAYNAGSPLGTGANSLEAVSFSSSQASKHSHSGLSSPVVMSSDIALSTEAFSTELPNISNSSLSSPVVMNSSDAASATEDGLTKLPSNSAHLSPEPVGLGSEQDSPHGRANGPFSALRSRVKPINFTRFGRILPKKSDSVPGTSEDPHMALTSPAKCPNPLKQRVVGITSGAKRATRAVAKLRQRKVVTGYFQMMDIERANQRMDSMEDCRVKEDILDGDINLTLESVIILASAISSRAPRYLRTFSALQSRDLFLPIMWQGFHRVCNIQQPKGTMKSEGLKAAVTELLDEVMLNFAGETAALRGQILRFQDKSDPRGTKRQEMQISMQREIDQYDEKIDKTVKETDALIEINKTLELEKQKLQAEIQSKGKN